MLAFSSIRDIGSQRIPRPSNKPPYTAQLVDPQEALGAGDSRIVYDLLPPGAAGNVYEKLTEEVKWVRMMHRGTMILQGIPCQPLIPNLQGVKCQGWSHNKERLSTRMEGKVVS